MFAVITDLNPLIIALHPHGYLHLADQEYVEGDSKMSGHFVKTQKERSNADEQNVNSRRPIKEFWDHIDSKNERNHIEEQIKQIVIKQVVAYQDIANRAYEKSNITTDNGFQMISYDFMIDTTNKVWLLDNGDLFDLNTFDDLEFEEMVVDTLNIIGVRLFDFKKNGPSKLIRKSPMPPAQYNKALKKIDPYNPSTA